MRVILNMATLRSHGSAWVGQGLLAGFGRAARGHRFLAYVPAQWDITGFAEFDHIIVRQVPDGWRGKLLAEGALIPLAFSRFEADSLFSLTSSSVLSSPIPHLLMIHQAYLAHDPAGLRFPLPWRLRAKLGLMAAVFRLTMRSVHQFTVQIPSMRRHLCARWGIGPERVHVIPSAVQVDGHVPAHGRAPTHQTPYVCYVAGPSPHKNFALTVATLAELGQRGIRPDCHLTLRPEQAPDLARLADQLGVADQIVWRGALTQAEVFDLLSRARAAIMPSWLESFGLPFYEALALGCPIVASDLDFAHDACGDAALYADPTSPLEFADQLQRVLEDGALREELRRRGRRRYQEVALSWDDVARLYTGLLQGMGRPKKLEHSRPR